jgi:hypothetical protein
MKRAVVVLAGAFMLIPCGAKAAAPPQLYGKSIVISWSETRVFRSDDRPQVSQHAMKIYISTAGRPFIRYTSGSRRGTGSREAVGFLSRTGTGGMRKLEFQGQSLVLVASFTNGARQVHAEFDRNYGGCTARVITGKASGVASFTQTSITGRGSIEVQSVSTGAATCSVEAGNVFAE